MTIKTEAQNVEAKRQTRGACWRRRAAIIAVASGILLMLSTGAAQRAQAQTYTILHSFAYSDGAGPLGTLVMDKAGNLYGTTFSGGASGYGTVFKVDRSGNETVLHSFTFSSGDGAYPEAGGLIIDSSGNLYGTTSAGGASGYGAVFKVDSSGNESVLHSFTYSDGADPVAGVVMDAAGNLYGTTAEGGSNRGGTVFKLDGSGNESVLHSFPGSDGDGANPLGGVILDSSGNLYGTTATRGASGNGIVFKLVNSSGTYTETPLYSFTNSDGAYPFASLLMDKTGNLYGTTQFGGASGLGTVFKLDSSGKETVLISFSGHSDGEYPIADVIMDAAGNLYGTASFGGASRYGTVFSIDASGNETVLHNFGNSGDDGEVPEGGLIMDVAGNFYGTTAAGGAFKYGTIFRLNIAEQLAVQAIVSQVNALYAKGVLNSGQDSPLVTELQDAIKMIDAGKTNGAIGNLESFIGEVNDLLSSGVLTSLQASALINAAKSVIAELQLPN